MRPALGVGCLGQKARSERCAGRGESGCLRRVFQSPSGILYRQKPGDKGEMCFAESRPEHHRAEHRKEGWRKRKATF